MFRIISQRALTQRQPIEQIHCKALKFDGFIANAAYLQQQQPLSNTFRLGQQNSYRFFTTTTTTTTTTITNSRNSLWRVFIRPHYYENTPKLSQALKQQQNPFRQLGRRINNTNPNTILWGVIGVNLSVYCFWQYAINCYRQFGDSSWLNFMAANFMNTREAIQHGHYHTLLTSAFSHKDMGHLGINMLVLYSMGQAAMEAIGASRFLLLYAGAGIMGNLCTQAYQKYVRPMLVKKRFFSAGQERFGALGASGAVMGITSFYACAFPRATFLLFFIIPMPAIGVVAGLAAYDIYQAYTLKVKIE
ncbi:hypothetical protein BDA99DRAFT_229095 [Phascolomyces articulosus]|uniref:Peptidase S54 rhomboid domain-containing protein n=1 Tax=Phascolomyces articulosus TaxID=60185 RepID=A0AAD5P8P3_9FUNG|nr:hypothetical protein BDA99DRAFT_229095 [Phascolomyces articulosus]